MDLTYIEFKAYKKSYLNIYIYLLQMFMTDSRRACVWTKTCVQGRGRGGYKEGHAQKRVTTATEESSLQNG